MLRVFGARENEMIAKVWLVATATAILGVNAVCGNECLGSSQGSATQAQKVAQGVKIIVEGSNWNGGSPADIQMLLENVAWHMTRHLRDGLDATIKVQNWPDGTLAPIILLRRPGQTTYRILLKTGGTRWAQYSYQFAHEFCHLVSGYERLEGSANSWFHESICEMAALFTLRSMGPAWKENPPYPSWRSYAEQLTQYAQDVASTAGAQMPEDRTLDAWLRVHEAEGREDPYKREVNRTVALRILPVFEQDPQGWNAISSLPKSDVEIRQYLALWKTAAHPSDRAFIERIEAVLRSR